jgi:putative ABC transport system permease protein
LNIFYEIKYAGRAAVNNPGSSLVVVLSLMIGLGVNTAIFGLANAVFFRPLPYSESDRLGLVWQTNRQTGNFESRVSYPNYADWLAQSHSFEDMAFFLNANSKNLTTGGYTQRAFVSLASANMFSVLGVKALLGRVYVADEELPGHTGVMLLSYDFWKARLGGDPAVLGRTVTIGGDSATIIGVMPPGFRFPEQTDIWRPRVITSFLRKQGRQYSILQVIGRLKHGVSWAQAQSEMDVISRQLADQYPTVDSGIGVRVVPLRQQLGLKVGRSLTLLWCSVVGVLFLACLNAGNLLMGRAVEREREVAIRLALGATRLRATARFLTEGLLFAFVGSGGGFVLAFCILTFVTKVNSDVGALHWDVFDIRVLAYTLAAACMTAAVSSALPSFSVSRLSFNRILTERAGASAAPRAELIRRVAVITEVALAFVLLVASGILLRSLWKVLAVNPGFDSTHILTLRIYSDNSSTTADKTNQDSLLAQFISRIQAMPGVVGVGATSDVLFSGETSNVAFAIDGRLNTRQKPILTLNEVTPNFFRVMGVPLIAGRAFNDSDASSGALPVIIISETLARQYWSGASPLDSRVNFDAPDATGQQYRIVGVVGDVRQNGLESVPPPLAYLPYSGGWNEALVVRATSDPKLLISLIRPRIQELSSTAAVDDIGLVSARLASNESQRSLSAYLLLAFASIALLLAVVGIYGTVSYWVSLTKKEVGIRIALGAAKADILQLVMQRGLKLVLIGLGVGALEALAITRFMSASLYDISAADPAVFGSTTILFIAVSLVACYIPARRAAATDAHTLLRLE